MNVEPKKSNMYNEKGFLGDDNIVILKPTRVMMINKAAMVGQFQI